MIRVDDEFVRAEGGLSTTPTTGATTAVELAVLLLYRCTVCGPWAELLRITGRVFVNLVHSLCTAPPPH